MVRRDNGFTLVELLLGLTLSLMLFLAVMGAYSQANSIKTHVQGTVTIQDNVRVAMDQLEQDGRMIGFGVPEGAQVGGTALWTPSVFYASPTELGFRAEIDDGRAEIICTPDSTNTNCPLSKLRLDSLKYYQGLNCAPPDGASGNLQLVAVVDGSSWQPLSCSGFNVSDTSISVATVANSTFTGGASHALTIEQVYLRYLPATQPPYGRLLRYVRYANTPDNSFPPAGASWDVVADHLTGFWLEYQDASGTVLTGNPLSAANRALISQVVLSIEGYDRVGPDGKAQLIETRSEILVRN